MSGRVRSSFLNGFFRAFGVLALCGLSMLGDATALAENAETSGLPLPRFVSLRAGEVNMRTGPGVQYPVEWVYQRQNLPVEVIAEFKTWRKIRDSQGTQGWVHQSMLGNRRTVIVTGGMRIMRDGPDAKARAVAYLEPGVVATLMNCPESAGWCRIETAGIEGWLRRVDFWGTLKDEVMEQRRGSRTAKR